MAGKLVEAEGTDDNGVSYFCGAALLSPTVEIYSDGRIVCHKPLNNSICDSHCKFSRPKTVINMESSTSKQINFAPIVNNQPIPVLQY